MAYRRQRSFWEEFRDYLIDEFKGVAKTVAVIIVIFFLIVSLFVGMYQVIIYLLSLPFR